MDGQEIIVDLQEITIIFFHNLHSNSVYFNTENKNPKITLQSTYRNTIFNCLHVATIGFKSPLNNHKHHIAKQNRRKHIDKQAKNAIVPSY